VKHENSTEFMILAQHENGTLEDTYNGPKLMEDSLARVRETGDIRGFDYARPYSMNPKVVTAR
jgi:hypothetical protein